MRVEANAKINIYLKVLGKNENGYHNLDSLMVPINLSDILYIEEAENDEIIGMDIPLESNLIYKAIKLIRDTYGIKNKLTITIEKNIPSFAGLGGGSSDAAAIIKALNLMWGLNLTINEMCSLAEKLGSDVPFFIYNKPAIISGRGEFIEIVEVPDIKGILIFSDNKFSTKEVFNNMNEYSIPYQKEEILEKGKFIKNIYQIVTNDMEKGITIYTGSSDVFKQKSELLELGAECASMSGSGSSVFGLFENNEKLEKAYHTLSNKYSKIWKFTVIK